MSSRLATVTVESLRIIALLEAEAVVGCTLRWHVDDLEVVVFRCSFDAKQTRQRSVHNCKTAVTDRS